MSTPHSSKVAGINPPPTSPEQTNPPTEAGSSAEVRASEDTAPPGGPMAGLAPRRPGGAEETPEHWSGPVEQLAAVHDRLATWVTDLTTLHELTERLARAETLDATLDETLRGGAALVGARRGLVALEPGDGLGPRHTVGLGLGRADLGQIETVPGAVVTHADIGSEHGVGTRHREVAARLGFAATHAAPVTTEAAVSLGAAMWLYDEPATPTERQRHLLGLYLRCAAEHIARRLDLSRARAAVAAVREELLPARLPRVPGVRMAVRHRTGPRGGGDWYDVLPLPEGALGLSVGGVSGTGPGSVAVMGRLRASLRAYAVMEGEDPVAVLSDLELLLRLTEPARCATALFGYAEPKARRVTLAGAGHCPPLIVGPRRCEFAETTLSAPLGMLTCWEAPSVELSLTAGETLLLYSDGLVQRTGEPMDRAFARLRSAVVDAAPSVRDDPEELTDHVLHTVLPDGLADDPGSEEDVVLLAARF
ncbi:PP2C family protein-serine/threonine phosphatase [Streptomyces sp. JJ38]|uniref:PP2C family protein-serine/threonine phosphatase n=1 Tax=Streptomyces sp. JJ38 TaxID=2738128 RepID=UPI001C564867|nr:PP2C family protein-serine/threonine phosphatase [Streptomyces sp. JJ38]MBW1598736.1 serine/threonine-protein phosphatase [Streptomyces sp. JJ38]